MSKKNFSAQTYKESGSEVDSYSVSNVSSVDVAAMFNTAKQMLENGTSPLKFQEVQRVKLTRTDF